MYWLVLFVFPSWTACSPLVLRHDLKTLRGDPQYEKIIALARTQFDEMLAVLQEAHARREFPQYLEKPLEDLLKELKYR